MRGGVRPRTWLPLVVLLLGVPSGGVSAQAGWAPTFVPPNHWAVDAMQRLAGLGLLPSESDVSRRSPAQQDVGEAFEHAARADSPYRELAQGYLRQFRREFGSPERSGGPALSETRATLGWTLHRHRLATGWGYGFYYPGVDWNQPERRRDVSEPAYGGTVQADWGAFGARLVVEHPAGPEALRDGYVAGRAGPLTGWLGRRTMGWGSSVGPGLIMNAGRYDSFGVQTRPFLLPSILSRLGPVALEMAVGQDDLEHSYENAGVFVTRGAVAPHERLQFGVTRAAFFGGSGNTSIGPIDILFLLIGKHAGEISELDNQVVSVDVSYRPPVPLLPLRLYVEWGFEDSAGAFKDVPGILAGIDVPAVPGAPGLAVAVERVHFASFCCGNPIWYRNSNFQNGWTQDRAPLGHPLGGHGDEWAAHIRFFGDRPGVRGRLSGFLRHRGDENLYADVRTGDSLGGTWQVELDIRTNLRGQFTVRTEDGEGWRESALHVGLQVIL